MHQSRASGTARYWPPTHPVPFLAANKTSKAIIMKYRGCREETLPQLGFFRRWESLPKRRWFKFQASCYFNYKGLVLIAFAVFRTAFWHMVSAPLTVLVVTTKITLRQLHESCFLSWVEYTQESSREALKPGSHPGDPGLGTWVWSGWQGF